MSTMLQTFGVFYWFQGFLEDTFQRQAWEDFRFFFPVHFHHVEVQIPRKAIAIAWSLELPKSLYVHAVHVTRRFGPGPGFDGNRRVKIDRTDPIHWVILSPL